MGMLYQALLKIAAGTDIQITQPTQPAQPAEGTATQQHSIDDPAHYEAGLGALPQSKMDGAEQIQKNYSVFGSNSGSAMGFSSEPQNYFANANTSSTGNTTKTPSKVGSVDTYTPSLPKLTAAMLDYLLPTAAVLGSGGYLMHRLHRTEDKAKSGLLTHLPMTLLAGLAAGTGGYYANKKANEYIRGGESANARTVTLKNRQRAIINDLMMKNSSLGPTAIALTVGTPLAAYLAANKVDRIANDKVNTAKAFMIPAGLLVGGVAGYGGREAQRLYEANRRKRIWAAAQGR